MALADAALGATGERRARSSERAAPRDGLALGLAQAVALIPGVSRSGATLTAARARGFARGDAQALSWHAALPVILGASALEGARAAPRGRAARAAAGAARPAAASAFVSTLAQRPAARGARLRGGRALLPYALYRCLLAIAGAPPPAQRAQ